MQTQPLTKAIRTLEGVLVFAFNVALLVVPIATNALSPTQAVKYAAIINGILVVARTGLKIVAVTQQTTGLDPVTPSGLPAPDVVAKEIQKAEEYYKQVQSAIGTAADEIKHGLAPEQQPTSAEPADPATRGTSAGGAQ